MSILDSIKELIQDSSMALGDGDFDRLPEDLREKLRQIERKFDSSFNSVDFNMPSTLGLEKLVYTEKTQDELLDLAKTALAASYQSSLDKIESNFSKNADSTELKKGEEAYNLAAKLAQAGEAAKKELQSTENETLRRGLARSSIREQSLNDVQQNAERKQQDLTSDTAFKIESLERQIENLQQQKLEAIKNLDTQHALELDAKIDTLIKQEQTAKENIEKYNNTVDEKEANYQKTRQAAYDAAVKANLAREKERLLLKNSVGESGMKDMEQQEKLDVVREFIRQSGMSKEEALEFVTKDNAFKQTLGAKYYAELENWLKGYIL